MTPATPAVVRLLPYSELPTELRTLSLRYLLSLARQGRFVRPIRVSPHAPPLWPEDQVRQFLAAKIQAAREAGQ